MPRNPTTTRDVDPRRRAAKDDAMDLALEGKDSFTARLKLPSNEPR